MPWIKTGHFYPDNKSERMVFENTDAGTLVSQLDTFYSMRSPCQVTAYASNPHAFQNFSDIVTNRKIVTSSKNPGALSIQVEFDRRTVNTALLRLVQSLDPPNFANIQGEIEDFFDIDLPSAEDVAPQALPVTFPSFARPIAPPPQTLPVGVVAPPLMLSEYMNTTDGDLPDSREEFKPEDLRFFAFQPSPEFDFDSIPLPEVSPPSPTGRSLRIPLSRLVDIPVRLPHGQIISVLTFINYDDPNIPEIDLNLQNTGSITLGDLHGNTLTLIIILIKCGILVCDQRDYDILRVTIHTISEPDPSGQTVGLTPLTRDLYINFLLALNRSIKVTENRPSVRLLGDIFGERMSNDALTLAVIGFLRDGPNQVSLNITFSNHDENFIRFLTYSLMEQIFLQTTPFVSIVRFIHFLRTLSPSDQLKTLIARQILAYIECVKMFDIDLQDSDFGQRVVLYSHASFHPRVGFETMKLLVQQTHFVPQPSLGDLTLGKLQHLIELSNNAFSRMLHGIAYNWINNFNGSSAFDPNHADRIRYLDLFRRIDKPEEPGYPGYPYFSLWLRLRNTHKPYDSIACSWQFLLPKLRLNNMRMVNAHGHDHLSRADDRSLDQKIGKESTHQSGPLRVMVRARA